MKGRTITALGESLPGPVKAAAAAASMGFYGLMRHSRTFTYEGKEYPYFRHRYNLAWRNERAVEIPIALELLSICSGRRVLEVGNVIGHYFDVEHDVLDKYERAEGVINADVVGFSPDHPYDLVLSISTLEHVGQDEAPPEPGKAAAALENMASFLAPGGMLLTTLPAGYNESLDSAIDEGALPFTKLRALKRTSRWNAWDQVPPESCKGIAYDDTAARATWVYVGYVEKPGEGPG